MSLRWVRETLSARSAIYLQAAAVIVDVDDLLGDPFGRRGMPGADSVAEDDVEFAYIKATEGEDFIDDRFEANWQAVQEAGLDRGAYHFFTLCTPGDDQAENFLQVALPDSNALAPAVDLELAGNCSARPPRSDVHSDLRNFIERVEDAWQREVLLYLGDDFESFYEVREVLDRPLWLRRFLLRPRGDWAIWQLHGYATVEGVSGGVDLDVMRQPQE